MYVIFSLINYKYINIKVINIQGIQKNEYFTKKYIKYLKFMCRYMLMKNNV